MTGTDIINIVLSRLGRQESNAYLVAAAKLEFKLVQARMEGDGFMPWFLLAGEQELTSTPGLRYIQLPDYFRREYDEFPLYRYDSTQADPYIRMVKDDFDILESQYGGTSATKPQKYALVGRYIHLFPTPDAAYKFRLDFYSQSVELDFASINTNVWTENAPDLMIGELGVVMASYKRDSAMAQLFAAEAAKARTRLIAFDEGRRQASRDAQRGDH